MFSNKFSDFAGIARPRPVARALLYAPVWR
jgi:hypothetical protein